DCDGHSPSIWFTFTATEDAPIAVDTHSNNFYTTLGVYQGTDVASLSLVACGDVRSTLESRLVFQAAGSETYAIRVSGSGGEAGAFTLDLVSALPQPDNDDFGDALVVNELPYSSMTDGTYATSQGEEPTDCDAGPGLRLRGESEVTFPAEAGITYYFRVSEWFGIWPKNRSVLHVRQEGTCVSLVCVGPNLLGEYDRHRPQVKVPPPRPD
ncbi:MAG: hypothetical protein LC750_05695, partial [Actinobacteria bacterium]|nr:hypothetical protein [Actinomycetota bacterium]